MRHLNGALVWIAVLFLPTVALADGADEKAACASAYEDAQTERMSGHFLRAQELLRACSRPACPKVVSRDCNRWYAEVEEAVPTVVFDVKGRDGLDIADIAVDVDGIPLAGVVAGKAFPLDPGPRRIVFRREGEAPIEVNIVVKESEKGRRIAASWQPAAPAASAATPAPATGPHPTKTLPVASYVLLGVGAAGIAAFGVFGAMGVSKRSDLQACRGACSGAEVDSVRTSFTVADVSLGVGLAAAAAGGFFAWAARSHAPTATAQLRLLPLQRGAFVGIDGAF